MKKYGTLMMKLVILLVIVLFAVFTVRRVISGKSGNGNTSKNQTLADQLYANKNQYIGENSKDMALVSLLPSIGDVTFKEMELQTSEEPYGLTLSYVEERMDSVADTDQILKNAIVLFSTIDNMGECTYEIYQSGTQELVNGQVNYKVTYTRTQVDSLVGKDVREYSKSSKEMDHLLKVIDEYKLSDLDK